MFYFKNNRIYIQDIIKTFLVLICIHFFKATTTLERHLVISDEPYTMERIKMLSNETNTFGTYGKRREVELPTIRGSLKLYVEERTDHSKFLIGSNLCYSFQIIYVFNFLLQHYS